MESSDSQRVSAGNYCASLYITWYSASRRSLMMLRLAMIASSSAVGDLGFVMSG